MDFLIRPPEEQELPEFRVALARGFGRHPRPEPEDAEAFCRVFERERSLAVFDAGKIIGTTGIFSYEMSLPGGAVMPVAGVTMVTVAATHRRRGILRQIMARQLSDVRDRGEPAAALWASESSIYGRFGYGLAIQHERWSIDRRLAVLAHSPAVNGQVRWVAETEARQLFPQVWARARLVKPGMIARSGKVWDNLFHDPEHRRLGGSAYFFAVYEEAGRAEGYVSYRIKMNYEDGSDAHVVMVGDLTATTDAAYAALWRLLLNIDLTAKVESWGRAVDEPLWWMLEGPRRLQRIPHDAIWLRLLDVPAALSRRTYLTPGRLVIEVKDDFCPWVAGRYALDAGPDGAQCKVTTAEPDIVLGAAELAAVYMGGHRMSPLARAGRAEERTHRALAKADAMFAWDVAPYFPHGF